MLEKTARKGVIEWRFFISVDVDFPATLPLVHDPRIPIGVALYDEVGEPQPVLAFAVRSPVPLFGSI